MFAQVPHHVINEQDKMQISVTVVSVIYGVKSVLVEYVNTERQIITGALCVSVVCMH